MGVNNPSIRFHCPKQDQSGTVQSQDQQTKTKISKFNFIEMQSLKNLILNKQLSVFRVLSNGVHTSRPCLKAEDRKEMLASMPVKDEGTEGEKTISIDTLIQK